MWPAVGSYLGHYRLVQTIDEGGMGMVYKAHEAALDRFVAIKVLSPELARDAEFVRSFLREARAVAALNHPNIIQIYFIGQHDEFIYFAMELIEGHAFDRLARLEKKPTAKDWLGYFKQAAMGLQYAHNHGVIHRDIKPANLILNEAGFVKVADFGLARKVGATGESSMGIADSMGTPEYMSPEESAGEAVDHRSDMYSLGASLFHMLAGRAPFSGASGTEIMMHQIHTPLPSLKKISSGIPQPVVAIVEKLMAKDPKQRYQRYEDLIGAIDAALHGKQTATRIAVSQSTAAAAARPAVQRKGPGGMIWVLIVGILAAAGFALWTIQKQNKDAEVQPLPAATNGNSGAQTVPMTNGSAAPIRPRPIPPQPRPTNAVAQVEPERASAWTSLNFIESCNRNVMSRRSDKVEGFTLDGKSVLMAKAVRRELGLGGEGLPDDGVVWIPEAVPFGKFTLFYGQGNDTVWFSSTNSRLPAQIRITPAQRRTYSRIAFLTSCANANGSLNVTLSYSDGPPTTAKLDLHNAHRHSAGVLKTAKPALDVTPGRHTENYTLYSQTISCEPTRILRHITVTVGEIRPAADAAPGSIVAGIFAISALPATPENNAAAGITPTPPPVRTNTTTVAPEPELTPAEYRTLSARLNPLVASLQLEPAADELKRLATAGGDRQRAHWTLVASDIKRIQSFKQRVIAATSDKAGRNVSLSYRTGAKLDAQLSSASDDELNLRKILPNAGFMSTSVRWTDLAPSSILAVFATVADPNNTDDLMDYGLLLLYQALCAQARTEDAQRALAAAAQREPKFKPDTDERIKWLGEEKTTAAAPTTEPTVNPATTPRLARGILLTPGPARWDWTTLDLSPACNADIIYTENRAATDDFAGGLGWTTSGWLSRNNIAGDFSGIPDDGRVMLPDLEPRTVLQVTMPPKRGAILLTAENGRQPKPIRLDLPPTLQGPHRGIALLHASAGGDILLNLDLIYADGTIRTRPIQTLDWRAAGRSHEFGPGQTVALSTRASRITDLTRRDMTVQLVPASEERKLIALIFSTATVTPPPDIPNYDPTRSAAALFAISLHPVTDSK